MAADGDRPGIGVRVVDSAVLRAEADIAAARERVALSVMRLEHEITRAVDWREWVRRRPGRCLGTAFVVGWLLGR